MFLGIKLSKIAKIVIGIYMFYDFNSPFINCLSKFYKIKFF